MDRLQAQLGSLLTRPMEDAATKELAEAARARVDVLRSLLRTPAVVGDDEYEAFLQGNGAPCHCLLYSPAGLAFDPGGSRTGVLQR